MRHKTAATESVPTDRISLGRPFAALWTASSVSTVGDGVRMAALPLMAAAITRNPIAVAIVSFSGQLPWLLTSLIAGAIADRADRRTVMWTVDACRTVVAAALAIAIVGGAASIAVLCFVAFLIGVGQTLFDNASQATVPELVPRKSLASANGRLMTTRIAIMSFLGPPLGAALFVAAKELPFLVDALSFALAAVLVGFFLRPGERLKRSNTSSLWTDIGDGLRWLAEHKILRSVGLLIAAVNFTQAATQSVLVLFALEILHTGQRGYGFLLAAMGVGGLIGGLSGKMLRGWLQPGLLFSVTIFITIPIFIVLGVTSSPIIAGLMLALNSFAGINASVLLLTLRQSIVPGHLLARVSSVMGMLGVGIGLPLGSVVGGAMATLSLRTPFFVSAVLIGLVSFVVPQVSKAFSAHEGQQGA